MNETFDVFIEALIQKIKVFIEAGQKPGVEKTLHSHLEILEAPEGRSETRIKNLIQYIQGQMENILSSETKPAGTQVHILAAHMTISNIALPFLEDVLAARASTGKSIRESEHNQV